MVVLWALFRFDLAIAKANEPVNIGREQLLLVSDADDGISLSVQILEDSEYLLRGGAIQITGRLISQQEPRAIGERTR